MRTKQSMFRFMLFVFVILFAATSTSALAMNEELVGAVVKTDQGVALSTDAGEYLITGKDLGQYAGETVAVTGEVEDGVLTKTIHVTSVRLLNPKDIIDPPTTAPGQKS